MEVVHIPKGSVHIEIKEVAVSKNYIGEFLYSSFVSSFHEVILGSKVISLGCLGKLQKYKIYKIQSLFQES